MPDPHKIFVTICKWTEKDSVSEWTPLYGQLIYEGNEIKYDAFGRVLGQANFQVPREFYQQEIDSDNHIRYYCFVNVDEKTLVYKEVGYNQQSSGGGGGGEGGGGGTQTRFITAENGVLTIPAENDYLNIWRIENGVEVTLETPSEAGDFLVSADFMMGSTAYIFTFDNNITWKNGVPDFPANETKHLKFEYVDGGWVGYEDPAMSQYMRLDGDNKITTPFKLLSSDLRFSGPFLSVENYGSQGAKNITVGGVVGGTNLQQSIITIVTASQELRFYCRSNNIQYNTHAQNTPGGFCISDATTGNLTIPGAPIYKGEYYQSLTAVSDGEDHNVITVPALTGEYYVCTVAQDDTITFASTTSGYVTKFSFDITVPETSEGSGIPVSFSFSDTTIITWEGGSQPTFGVGTHKLKFECVNGVWYGSYRPDMSEYAKLSGATFTGPITLATGTYGNDPIYWRGRTFLSYSGVIFPQSVCVDGGFYTTSANASYSSIALGYNTAGGPSNVGQLGVGHYGVSITGARFTGAGTSSSNRKNIEELDWDGNLTLAGSCKTAGNKLTALDSTSITAIPAVSGATYTYTLTGDEAIDFGTPTAGYSPTFELWLTMPTTAVTFSFTPTIIWSNNGRFASYNPAPDFTEGGLVYRLVFQYDGTSWLGNLVSVKEV